MCDLKCVMCDVDVGWEEGSVNVLEGRGTRGGKITFS
jgi:hypothetical protein